MSKKNYELFTKGDIILTSPEIGYYGIAIVLDDAVITREGSLPECHIAITPLIYDHIVDIDEIDVSCLKPLVFNRRFCLKGKPHFFRQETMIHIYCATNNLHLPVLGKIDPFLVYQGDLPWVAQGDIFHVCGPINRFFGREAYLAWIQENHAL